jgi:hypothetical protein
MSVFSLHDWMVARSSPSRSSLDQTVTELHLQTFVTLLCMFGYASVNRARLS